MARRVEKACLAISLHRPGIANLENILFFTCFFKSEAWCRAVLCGYQGNSAGSLPKHQNILWTKFERILREDEVEAAGEEATARGLCCQWRCLGAH